MGGNGEIEVYRGVGVCGILRGVEEVIKGSKWQCEVVEADGSFLIRAGARMEVEYYEKIEQVYSFDCCGCYFMYISDDGYGV